MANGAGSAAIVPVEPVWASKINWAALIGFVAGILSLWDVTFSAEAQNAVLQIVLALVNIVIPAAIFIFRTWFTQSVTPASVANATRVDLADSVGSATGRDHVVVVQ